ncbi:WD40-repeat-containing domain protein [Pisolithus sp. B1]|nr:WD40-repeat-containing domain protein [Pisolithus sp. B1]
MGTQAVVFTTKTGYVLPSQKFMIPVEWRRYQLSQLINKALSLTDPIPFDFLVSGEILRTSLAEWTAEKGVGEEETLEVEYFESVLPPQRLSALPHDDWVSSVSCSISQHFLTASYDGHVRLFDHSQNCIRDVPAHLAPGPNTSDHSCIIASASHDLTARLTKISLADDTTKPSQPLATLHLHTSLLTSVAAGLHCAVPIEDDVVPESGDRKKRRKIGDNDRPKNKVPATVLKSHTARVSKAIFAPNSRQHAHSCGFDSTVRHWDVETTPERPMLDLSLTNDENILLAASTDRTVSIFDLPRLPAPQVMVGSYDGIARLWDLRSVRSAIASFRVWEGMKILDVDWAGDTLCVGGEGGVDIWRISQGERISATAQK